MKDSTTTPRDLVMDVIDSIFAPLELRVGEKRMYDIEQRKEENFVRVYPVVRQETELDALKAANSLIKASVNMVNSVMEQKRVLGAPELLSLERSLVQATQRLEQAEQLIKKRL